MAAHAGTADGDLGHRTRNRQARDISHRFRRQPAGMGARLFLAIGVAALLALALRPVVGPRRDLARGAHPEAAPPPTRPVVGAPPILADAPVLADAPILTNPPAGSGPVFRVQVASFLDPRNALRMVERLRGEGLPAETRVARGHQARYRVLVTPGTGETDEELIARLRVLGVSAAVANGEIAVTGSVSTEDADAIASRLEDEAIAVRVEREQRAVSYHAVRVGTYRAPQDAERARVELAARGLEGLVVQVSDDGPGGEQAQGP
jgi:cell division protein FtsN